MDKNFANALGKAAKNDVLYLGSNGFPVGMAEIQRQRHLARALQLAGLSVCVVSRKGVHRKLDETSHVVESHGQFENIKYFYCSGTPRYSSNFFSRNFRKLLGFLTELLLILLSKAFGSVSLFLVNTIHSNDLKYYRVLSRVLRVPLVYDYVEQLSSLSSTKQYRNNIDYELANYADGIIYISEYLKGNLTHNTEMEDLPLLKVLPVTDFEQFENIQPKSERPFFLFCGSARYVDVLSFITGSFEQVSNQEVVLILVINGPDIYMKQAKQMIQHSKHANRISVKSNLSDKELISYYKGAIGLLIPLRDNVQDKARFPHKISEYTASKRPIVTTQIGEVAHYFVDGSNALVANHWSEAQFAQKMNWIVENPKEAEEIGRSGWETGRELFDYRAYSKRLIEFTESLKSKSRDGHEFV